MEDTHIWLTNKTDMKKIIYCFYMESKFVKLNVGTRHDRGEQDFDAKLSKIQELEEMKL